MRILIFNWRDITHPQAGGAEKFIHEIGKRLAKEHEVTLWCGKYKGCKGAEEIDGIKIIRNGSKFRVGVFDPTIYVLAGLDYLSKLRKKRFDVVIDSISGLPFFTPLFAKELKIAILHHLNRGIFFKEVSFPAALISYFGERAIPALYRNVRFITVSESSREELINLGISPSKIAIVYNGVDSSLFSKNYEKNDYPHVIYFGRLKRYKRLDLLIRSMKLVIKEVPDAKLTIAGSGDAEKELMTLISDLDLKDSVIFRGYVDEEEKAELLGSAWAFVSPSSKEGWGITVLEANACGTPAIAYDVPGLRDSIIDGKTGLLVESGDVRVLAEAIVKVLEDRELRKRLGENALRWAKRFSWDDSAMQFLKILEGVIASEY
ncbi:MAG: glycosyltransferase family 4 protein [Actinobacteria bacterium]|nr:glycosyltransferase family 4 protein [Actinomycetota bacterium]